MPLSKGLRFVVTTSKRDAAMLTDVVASPADRGAQLAELVADGRVKAGAARVRRDQVAVAILAVMPGQQAYDLLAIEPRHRRRCLAAIVAGADFLFVGASLAAHDAPAVAYCGVPLADFWRAQQDAKQLAATWSPDTRVRPGDQAEPGKAAS